MELCKWHLVRVEEMSTGQGGAGRHGEVPGKGPKILSRITPKRIRDPDPTTLLVHFDGD